jgi:UDP-N-acetylmuramate dehydrogenase
MIFWQCPGKGGAGILDDVMNKEQRSQLAKILSEGIEFDCPMAQYTTFRTGGRAEAVCFPSEPHLLQQAVSYLHNEGIPFLVVGKGSNILVRDTGFKGAVIILTGNLAGFEKPPTEEDSMWAGGGVTITKLLSHCVLNDLAGLEFLAGIPGTVGGAVFMNAGAFGKEIGGMVGEIRTVDSKGKQDVVPGTGLTYSYRQSSLAHGTIIYKVKFQLHKGDRNNIKGRIEGFLKKRRETQPLDLPSGGSVFRNPPGDYAGRLIEKAGLKGKSIGGATISTRHANFIVNTGGATADDILSLMNLARERVREETGIVLEPEIKVVGL